MRIIEKLKEIQNTVLLINVDKGDVLDKKSKKQALILLAELIQQKNIVQEGEWQSWIQKKAINGVFALFVMKGFFETKLREKL